MIKADLKEMQDLLENIKYNCKKIDKTEAFPVNQLVVELERDIQGRDRYLVIRLAKQELSSQDVLLGIKYPPKNYQELQFIVTLPFFVKDEKIPDISRLILLLNKGIELPGFELSEVDRLIYYRYGFVVPEDNLDERILLSITGMIQFLLEAFNDLFEAVATGSLTFQEVVEEAKQLIQSQEKKNNNAAV